jgi:hypothetical protein
MLRQTVEKALQEKAPSLHADLAKAGTLGQYVTDLTNSISSEIVTSVMEARGRGKWDQLGPMECARKMKAQESLETERALAQMLEFPQDETSPPSEG